MAALRAASIAFTSRRPCSRSSCQKPRRMQTAAMTTAMTTSATCRARMRTYGPLVSWIVLPPSTTIEVPIT